jgi:hypothetical protein
VGLRALVRGGGEGDLDLSRGGERDAIKAIPIEAFLAAVRLAAVLLLLLTSSFTFSMLL